MDKKDNIVESEQTDEDGRTETYLKINETPENVAKAIFSSVRQRDPELRKEADKVKSKS